MKRAILVFSVLAGAVVLPLAARSQNVEGVTPRALVESRPDGASLLRDFQNGLIVEVGIPALDKSSREGARISVKYAHPHTPIKVGNVVRDGDTSLWLPANFRFEIDGLDCSKVSKIEAITIKQTAQRDAVGEPRVPNLVVWVDAASARTWLDWAGTSGRGGDGALVRSEGRPRPKSFSMFLSDGTPLRDVLEVHFTNATVASTRRVTAADGSASVQVEMYCENITLSSLPPRGALTPAPASSASPSPLPATSIP